MEEPWSLLLAVEDLALALEQDSNCTACWFNYALALQLLFLPESALAAWIRFLELENESGWATEARENIRVVELQLTQNRWSELRSDLLSIGLAPAEAIAEAVEFFPYKLRRFVELEILASALLYAGKLRRPLATDSTLARLVGERLFRERGDRYLLDLVDTLQGPAITHGQTLSYIRYVSAQHAYENRDLNEARSILEEVLSAPDNLPFPAGYAAQLLKGILVYLQNVSESIPIFLELEKTIDARVYPSLAGEVQWMLGTIRAVQGDLAAASQNYKRAHALLAVASGTRRAAAVSELLADLFDLSDRIHEGWDHRFPALQATQPGTRRRHATLIEAAEALMRQRQDTLAGLFLEELVANALRWGEIEPIVEASVRQTRFYLYRGEIERAEVAFQQARKTLVELDMGSTRVILDFQQVEAELTSQVNPKDGLLLLDRAHSALQKRGYNHAQLEYHQARARALLLQGDVCAATETLLEAAGHLEVSFDELRSGTQRLRFSHRRRVLYDELIQLLVSVGDARGALELANRLKVWSLYPDQRAAGLDDFDLDEYRRELPFAVTALVYHVLPNETLVWVLGRGTLELHRVPLTRDVLESLVAQARQSLLVAPLEARNAKPLLDLHTNLLEPVSLSPDTTSLVIVADGPLQDLPFLALISPHSGEYLVERFNVASAPALQAELKARRIYQRHLSQDRPLRALAIGVGGSHDVYSSLPGLQHASYEAGDVAAAYSKSTLLVDSSATTNGVAECLSDASVLHLATHSFRDGVGLDGAKLLLYGSDILTAREVRGLFKPNLELAVLSSCNSAEGFSGSQDGYVDLAMSFFGTGIPNVIASIDSTEDQSARMFAQLFHQNYAAMRSALPAFTATVRSLVASQPTRVDAWLTLVFVGSHGVVSKGPKEEVP